MGREFIHLHNHSEGSLADATLRIKDMARRAKEFGMKHLAITDHGVMFKALNFYNACKEQGVNPIIGCETYVAPRRNTLKEYRIDDKNWHLVLLCENNEGYQNLIQIVSDAAKNGFYSKPRTDKFQLRKYSKGIICLSACLGGEVQEYLMADNYDAAKQSALEYNDIFGAGNFYLELQDHGIPEQKKVNEYLVRMHEETGIPLVCTNDCHYLNRDGAVSHDILMAIQAKVTVDSKKRKIYPSSEFYLKSQDEMCELFKDYPDAIDNTVKIAERCHVDIIYGVNKIPEYFPPEGYTSYDYLSELTYKGLSERYDVITDEIKERVEYELSVIKKMQYVDYFLIVWDFINEARRRGILVGPGRGSGAGSIVLYSLKVTAIDPIENGLLFERFLDPSRISMPDVDIDWQDDRRHEIIDYVVEKYGRESIAQIITFGTMAARGSIRNVGRALGIKLSEVDTVAKMIPAQPGITIEKAMQLNPDLKAIFDNKESHLSNLIKYAMDLEGLPTYTSTHAAGVLITDRRGVTAHVPVYVNDGAVVSQYDMGILDKLCLLKMDFLGLKTLTVIANTINHIKRNHGVDVNLDELYKCEDETPWSLIKDGKTDAVFQLESGGMSKFMKEFGPKNLSEVTAGISLYRPGPMQYIPKYLENRKHSDTITYEFEELRPILSETYGVLTYQEQCMKTVIALAGYQKHHSDSFRKAIAKKKADMIAQHREWFINGRKADGKQDAIPGGIAMGFSKEKLEKLYSEMEEFGKYCFNKSHAAAYATVAYVTAWLKYYYPEEFMAATIDNTIKKKSKVARYIKHCREDLGIEVLPPDINHSISVFNPVGHTIVMSLALKSTSVANIIEIEKERFENGDYTSTENFIERCVTIIDKSTFKAIVASGGFDKFGIIRSQWMAATEELFSRISKYKNTIKSYIVRQEEINSGIKKKPLKKPDLTQTLDLKSIIPDIREFDSQIKIYLEHYYSGLWLTENPLDKYGYISQNWANIQFSDLDYEINEETGEYMMLSLNVPQPHQKVQTVAVVTEIIPTVTRAKQEQMAICLIEDKTSAIKLLVFPRVYSEVKNILKENHVYKITGEVNYSESEEPVIFAKDIAEIEASQTERALFFIENIEEARQIINELLTCGCPGETPVYFIYGQIRVLLNKEYWINIDDINRYSDLKNKLTIRRW